MDSTIKTAQRGVEGKDYTPQEPNSLELHPDWSKAAGADQVKLLADRSVERVRVDEKLAAPVELKKTDGSTLEIREGLVTSMKRGDNHVSIEYERGVDNKIALDAQGNPRISKIESLVGGQKSEIDLSAFAGTKEGEALSKRISVVQNGDSIGNITIASADGKTISTLRSDFSRVDHEKVMDGGKETLRVKSTVRPDGATVSYSYNDDANPLKVSRIVESYKTSMGNSVTQYTDRVGDSDKFVTYTDKNDVPAWRTGVKISKEGELAYQELVEKFHTGPREYGAGTGDLQAAREEFLNVAADHGVFKGNENKILAVMGQFEGRLKRIDAKGWKAPSETDIADTYTNLTRVFTDGATGRAQVVSKGERRLAVETCLQELADPVKNINQGSIGTCALNSCEDELSTRRPQDITRWMRQALTKGYVTSLGVDKNGNHKVINLSEQQLKYEPTWNRTYSNQLFQFAAMAALGYRSRGYDYGGTTNDQLRYVHKLASGQDIKILDNWMSFGARRSDIVNHLKNKGSLAYIIPGHAMAIDDYDPKTDRFLVNNWWGGTGDGWYSAGHLGIR